MRRPILAGNWKMHMTIAEATDFVRSIRRGLNGVKDVDRVLCPPFTVLAAVRDLLSATEIGLGAQNMHWEEKGAYTGEVSPRMVQELAQYVILGHSERRAYFHETDEMVNRKIHAALAHGLLPIVCVGETEAQHDAGQTEEVVGSQVRACLAGLTAEQAGGLVIAYEPVWAIGTGKAATVAGAGAVIGLTIRGTVAELYDQATAQAVRVQYGGSVNPGNIAEFMAHPDVDGALVGGASLKPDFVDLVRVAAETKR
ncbi:MAG: triose-phosphate isomerase [Anaerolineae bacterium]|jgi:triosephosphate isomerase|nr:triose-phosphate isomerase [Anaerolineae bacterium]